MRLDIYWFTRLAVIVAIICVIDARRVRIQTVEDDDDDAQYYSGEPQDAGRQVVLVSSADDYNGVYGQQPLSRNAQDNYIPAPRGSSSRASSFKDARVSTKETKAPPVQTIRNYNKVNDDGSFTFGYEAADGSFKEETRGTDCVVRGKYGYVDPDGNKREFTYVSGNPCDPNAAKDEESRERQEEESNEPENIPANYPSQPIRPLRPLGNPAPLPPKPVTVFQNQYEEEDEVEQEPEQVLRSRPVQPQRHRLAPARPAYVPEERPTYIQQRQRVYPSTTPATVSYHDHEEPRQLTITPRPLTVTPTPARAQPPATTYRPQLLQVAVTPRPALVYSTKQITSQRPSHYASSTPASVSHSRGPGGAALDFASEFQRFQQDNQIISSTARPVIRTTKPARVSHGNGQSNAVYSSELVYDPASGQYNTALYQTLPQTEGEFTLNHQIQPYVHQPQAQLVNIRQLQQSSLYNRDSTTPRTSQAVYQQQQSDLQFQNSQQLYAQQQQARVQQQQQQQQQQQHQQQPQRQAQRVHQEPQQFYYVQPQAIQSLANGQIDAFLRGHNIQF